MLTGRVDDNGTAWLPFEILSERPIALEGVVDTGFDDYLVLPRSLRAKAKLRPIGTYRIELADGREVRARVYLARIRFDRRTWIVPATLTRSQEPLLGTALLRNRKLLLRYRRRVVTLDVDR